MPSNHDVFKDLLRSKGLKITTQRIAILDVLRNHPDQHLTAEEIYENVKEQYPEIGLATVYRTIQLLSDLHLIDKLNLDDGYARYEIGNGDGKLKNHHHHHLICLRCHDVISFQDDLLEELETSIKRQMEFEVVDHEVKLYGYCKKCREEMKECNS